MIVPNNLIHPKSMRMPSAGTAVPVSNVTNQAIGPPNVHKLPEPYSFSEFHIKCKLSKK